MEGYIILKGESYLTKGLFWYKHESVTDAYVFTAEQTAEILIMAERWGDNKPTMILRAKYEG